MPSRLRFLMEVHRLPWVNSFLPWVILMEGAFPLRELEGRFYNTSEWALPNNVDG